MSNAVLHRSSRDVVHCKNERMSSVVFTFGEFSNNEGLGRTAEMSYVDAKLLLLRS
ncbi:hypothetical protein SAMN05446635_7802 [Burkholderia sp. OK233]|nr:hypothetical protein SAMN05446635_7802 [Burkholderia sp. OK233]